MTVKTVLIEDKGNEMVAARNLLSHENWRQKYERKILIENEEKTFYDFAFWLKVTKHIKCKAINLRQLQSPIALGMQGRASIQVLVTDIPRYSDHPPPTHPSSVEGLIFTLFWVNKKAGLFFCWEWCPDGGTTFKNHVGQRENGAI